MDERIYVQIPAYRDSELVSTLKTLMETANRPHRVRVAVAWQYETGEAHLENQLVQYGGVELIKIPAVESRGCNWARRLLQNGWAGERYTLFLDSHHRFVPGWDDQVIVMLEQLRHAGIKKPIVTAYLPPYNPRTDPHGRTASLFKICLLERHQGMLFRLTGHEINTWRQLSNPVPASFASLHFLFADGFFNREIQFDPLIYFFADEVAIALRAYTHGYDLFHPHRILGWHLYDRSTRVTHWADHPEWKKQQERSCQRLRALFGGQMLGESGIGTTRSIADYEKFIGMQLWSDRN